MLLIFYGVQLYKFLERHKKKIIYIPLIIYWVVLLIATTLPGKDVPDIGVSDKIEHFSAYAVLTVFICLTYMFQKKIKLFSVHPFIFSVLTVMLYAAIDEFHQIYIPGRTCDIRDWTADLIGALAGITFVMIIIRINIERKIKAINE